MRILDLFAGAGGWDVAAERLGHEAHGVELMTEAVATRNAVGLVTRWNDVRKVVAEQLDYQVEIASPPCQSFSMAGHGTGRRALDVVLVGARMFLTATPPSYDALTLMTSDERTALVLEPLRIALVSRPEFIAWEQVPQVLPVWEECAEVLRANGYGVSTGILNSEQYGVPQTRRRAVLLARRDGVAPGLPTPTYSRFYVREPDRFDPDVKPWVSMSEALGWGTTQKPAPTVCGGGTDMGGAEPFGNGARKGLIREIDAGRWAYRNGNQAKVSWVQRSNYSAPGPGTAVERGRSVRSPEQPSLTLTGKPPSWAANGDPASSAGIRVTVDEAAALQTFPNGFPFQGSKGKRYQQVGNAVPPLLAEAILFHLLP